MKSFISPNNGSDICKNNTTKNLTEQAVQK